MSPLILEWKRSLQNLLEYYDRFRPPLLQFFPRLFLFFIALNIFCYWCAMATAFPWLLKGSPGVYYFKVQFPVGFLGALFDSASFFITIYIIRKALATTSSTSYLGHLLIDLLIAILAACWVLFVFSISG